MSDGNSIYVVTMPPSHAIAGVPRRLVYMDIPEYLQRFSSRPSSAVPVVPNAHEWTYHSWTAPVLFMSGIRRCDSRSPHNLHFSVLLRNRIYALLSILFAGPRNSIGRWMPSALDGCATPLDDLLALLCTQVLEEPRKSCAPVFECPVTRCEGVCAYRTASRVMDGRPCSRSTALSWRSR